jgi:hypothetical protein
MQVILSREEVVIPLAKKIISRYLKKLHPDWRTTRSYLKKCKLKRMSILDDQLLQNKLHECINKDLQVWKDRVVVEYKSNYRKLVNWLASNYDTGKFQTDGLIQEWEDLAELSLIKNVAYQFSPDPKWLVQSTPIDTTCPVLFRNIIHNEAVLHDCLTTDASFWFIDSGYTNFLAKKKLFHRIVKDHIHPELIAKYYPADRLSMLPSFPHPWRTTGHKILIVESSQQYYQLIGTTLEQWRQDILDELVPRTDREIIFKSKDNKKTRVSVYQQLQENPEDYYCVISDASAAAIEAIWLGIPVITLNRHITNSVSRSTVGAINNLYRGPIGNWLCGLTYSQFTAKELCNGTALKLLRKYHA